MWQKVEPLVKTFTATDGTDNWELILTTVPSPPGENVILKKNGSTIVNSNWPSQAFLKTMFSEVGPIIPPVG